jgi:prolyl-tRNA synthetase
VRAASVAKKAKNAQRSTDYKAHYFANDRAIFILFSRFTPVDFANALLKGIPHLLELGPKYFVSNSLFFAGLVTSRATNAATNSMPSFFSSRQPSLASLFSTP